MSLKYVRPRTGRLYALFKQGSSGPCTTSRPGMLDFVGTAKWDVWKKLGEMTGISSALSLRSDVISSIKILSFTGDEAQQLYVALVTQLYPEWENSGAAQGGVNPKP